MAAVINAPEVAQYLQRSKQAEEHSMPARRVDAYTQRLEQRCVHDA